MRALDTSDRKLPIGQLLAVSPLWPNKLATRQSSACPIEPLNPNTPQMVLEWRPSSSQEAQRIARFPFALHGGISTSAARIPYRGRSSYRVNHARGIR